MREHGFLGKGIEAHKARVGILFTLPWILGLLIFYAYPLLSSVYYSFTSYSILNPGEFVGLANYEELANDTVFIKSVTNTLIFTVMSVPALLLNEGWYRESFPVVIITVISASTIPAEG